MFAEPLRQAPRRMFCSLQCLLQRLQDVFFKRVRFFTYVRLIVLLFLSTVEGLRTWDLKTFLQKRNKQKTWQTLAFFYFYWEYTRAWIRESNTHWGVLGGIQRHPTREMGTSPSASCQPDMRSLKRATRIWEERRTVGTDPLWSVQHGSMDKKWRNPIAGSHFQFPSLTVEKT